MPLRQIQEMLGHADLKTTTVYIGNDKVELQRVQEATSLSGASLPHQRCWSGQVWSSWPQ